MKRILVVLLLGLLAGGCSLVRDWRGGETYIRAEAGYSNPRSANLRDDNPTSPECFLIAAVPGPCNGELNDLGHGRTFGVGLGFRFTEAFRADLTYNRRTGYNLRGADPAGTSFDPPVKSDSIMLNGFFDLPVMMKSIRPFIGAGIGRSRNDMDPIHWNDPGCCTGVLTGGKKSDTAWQITLGADIALDKGWVLEVLYRYADMGDIRKDRGPDQAGLFGTGVTGPATGKLRSDEIVVGVRRSFR